MSIKDADLDRSLNYSDEEHDDAAEARFVSRAAKKKKGVQREVHKQEIDTNVFLLQMSTLKEGVAAVATGDPVFCEACKAVFNKDSKLSQELGQQIWSCEFCCKKNEVNIDDEEIPTSDAVNFILEAPAAVGDKKVQKGEKSDISVVFCIDTSGSMCVSEPI